MQEINCFSLEGHTGEYETWPLRSRLFRGGTVLPLTLPGYSLLRQYATVEGYLLVTDYDCPYEEETNFILVDKDCKRILGERSFGTPYASWFLEDLFWHDDRRFTAIISGTPISFKIRSFYIPYLYPKIGIVKEAFEFEP